LAEAAVAGSAPQMGCWLGVATVQVTAKLILLISYVALLETSIFYIEEAKGRYLPQSDPFPT